MAGEPEAAEVSWTRQTAGQIYQMPAGGRPGGRQVPRS